jgi:hypothetical protein
VSQRRLSARPGRPNICPKIATGSISVHAGRPFSFSARLEFFIFYFSFFIFHFLFFHSPYQRNRREHASVVLSAPGPPTRTAGLPRPGGVQKPILFVHNLLEIA